MKLSKEFKKKVHEYIGKNLDRGYSYNSIKASFIIHGYNSHLAEKLIRDYKIKGLIIKTSPLALVLLAAFIIIFYKPNITSFGFYEKNYNYTDKIGLMFNQSSNYTWNLQNNGLLKSIKLDGEVKMSGTVRAYLKHGNDTFLIFDNKKLETKVVKHITGFVVKKENIQFEISGGLSTEEQIIIDNLVADLNKTRNNVEIKIKAEDNLSKEINGNVTGPQELLIDTLFDILRNKEEKINISIYSDFNENEITIETNQMSNLTINITPSLNESNITLTANKTINISPENLTNITLINYTINIALDYEKNSPYNVDNNGIENINGVIGLNVEKTKFSWDVAQENLCTRWNIYSIDNNESTSVCYGSEKCCNFVDLPAKRYNWSQTYYSAYGKDGATLKNIISAQVLYVDYSLSLSNPYSNIYYSDWKNLTAQFYEGFTRFENICLETCALPNYNDTSYELVFEVENSSLILNSISYEVLNYEHANNKPVLLKNFSDISIKKDRSYIINLSEYFYDEDNDNLIFDYYNSSGTNISIINVKIINDTAILQANDNPGTVFMYFIANDTKDLTTSNIFRVEVTENKKGPLILKSLRQVLGIA